MKFLLFAGLLLAGAGSAAQSTEQTPVSTDNPRRTPLDRQIDSLVTDFLRKHKTVGLSIGILRGDSTFYFNYGETAKGNGQLPARSTLYEIGSISKTFTATLLADAARRGRIDMNAPVNNFLPDSLPILQKNGKRVTLTMLANHTSGMPRLPTNLFTSTVALVNPYREYDRRKLFAYLMKAELAREPGKEVEYSNLGAGLLGTLLENGLNSDYEELLQKRIAGPLGMKSTALTLNDEQKRRFAQGHDGGGKAASSWEFLALAGAGGIRSTTEDMLKYLRAELGDGPRTLVRAMQLTQEKTATQGDRAIGLGWFWNVKNPQPWYWHNGGTGGFSTFAAFNLRRKTALVVLTNSQIQSDPLSLSLLSALETP